MSHEFSFAARIEGDTLVTPGTSWSGPIKVMFRKGNYAVVRVRGGTGWAGIGMTSYTPTKYMLLRFEEGRAFEVERIEPGKFWREALKNMIKRADVIADRGTVRS